MPNSATAAVCLFWAQILGGVAAAIFIVQWMRGQAARFKGGDMTSLPMKYPMVLLLGIALSTCGSIVGLWIVWHLSKPVIAHPCSTSQAQAISPSTVPTYAPTPAQPHTALPPSDNRAKVTAEITSLASIYGKAHPNDTLESETKWINEQLAKKGYLSRLRMSGKNNVIPAPGAQSTTTSNPQSQPESSSATPCDTHGINFHNSHIDNGAIGIYDPENKLHLCFDGGGMSGNGIAVQSGKLPSGTTVTPAKVVSPTDAEKKSPQDEK